MKPVTVIATFQAKPGKEAELKKALMALVAPTHKEDGCINYDLHELPENPAKFLFHENWTSKPHLDAHLKNKHIEVLLPRLNDLCIGMPEIIIWEKIT
jgi:quinol monooxygenase YgiN